MDVVATEHHIGERLTRALDQAPRTAAVLAPRTLSWRNMVSLLLAQVAPTFSLASPEVERLALAAAVREVLPRYDPAFTERADTVDACARTLAILRVNGVDCTVLGAAMSMTADADEAARSRLKVLAAMLDAQERRLAAAGCVAAASVEYVVARALDAHGKAVKPTSLGIDRVLRVWHLRDLPPARVALLSALARWLASHAAHLELHIVCEPSRMKLPGALDHALRVFEADESGAVELRYGLRDPSADAAEVGLARWVQALATGGRAADAPAIDIPVPLSLAEAQGPDEEARWVASRIERWIAQGLAAHEIAVVLPSRNRECVAAVTRALDDARIPYVDTRPSPLLASPVARALLGLPLLVARGAVREEVLAALAVLQGNAPRGDDPAPWRVAEALRTMDVESLFDTRLPDLCARARRKGISAAVLAAIEALARDLWALSLDGSVEEHAARLERWVLRAGGDGRFLEESRAVVATAATDAGAHVILRALARDERGLAAASELLQELPSVARAVGRNVRMSAGEFGEMLLDVARVRLLGVAQRPYAHDAIHLLDASDVVGRDLAAVMVPSMHDGASSARRDEEAFWGDAERVAVGRALKRPLDRTGARESETLLTLAVFAAARREAAASVARHDAGGRVLATSPLFADMQRTSTVAVERVSRDPLARARHIPPRGPERMLRHLAQVADPASETMTPAMREALGSVRARAAVERTRQEYFARGDAIGDRYSGRIDHDPSLMARLGLSSWAGARRPLSVTTLERAARCGYKAFAQEVLRIEEYTTEAETLDDKGRGHLLHKLLEAGQDALSDTREAPYEERAAAVRAALDEAAAEFAVHEARLNASLLEADIRAIRRQVELWIERRMNDGVGWSMVETEVAFGPRKRWPALEVPVPGGESVLLHGRIDAVERAGTLLRVLEFKSGRGDGFRKRLQEGVLDTQFQMVVYAAALERARRTGVIDGDARSIDGVYVGFRDLGEHGLRDALGRPHKGESIDVDALVQQGAEGAGPLGDAVRRVVLPLRAGHFEPRPRDCDFCQYRSLCRVEAHEVHTDEAKPLTF